MEREDVAIIILNYNGWQDTLLCLKSTRNIKYPHKLIVVDNCSSDNSVEKLKTQCDGDIMLIQTDFNLGYAGGNNVGIKYAVDNNYKYCCILNNDTIIEDDFMEACIGYLKDNSNVAFVGPTILNYTNRKIQSTGGDIYINKGSVKCKNANADISQISDSIESDYLGGACIIFRLDLIHQIGLIPESYFLFFEETEWCWKALKQGYKNVCIGKVSVLHKGSMSINKVEGLNEYLLTRNRIAFIRRNHPSKFCAFLIYLFRCIRAVGESFKYGPKRLRKIIWLSHGWFKLVDTKKYPFIIIKE